MYVFNGEYKIEHYYCLNDFLENSKHNHLFRVSVLNENNYLIITDISFLLFSHCKGTYVKLLYVNEIIHFDSFESICESNGTTSKKIKWNNQYNKDSKYNDEIFNFSENDFKKIETIIKENKIKLMNQFKKIIYIKEPISSTLEIINFKEELLISYKTDINKTKQANELLNELIILYQKLIEMLSSKGDLSYIEYISKLKTLLEKKN